MTKLAEALILRADYQKRIEQLRQRLTRNAKTQEGDRPAEDPAALLAEIERIAADLAVLIQRINRTNAATPLEGEGTLADAIATRDVLRLRHGIYNGLAGEATAKQDRFTKSEIRFVSSVDVAEIQRQADDLARRYRELDTRIQALNWNIDLLP
jgi:hypothetical protein